MNKSKLYFKSDIPEVNEFVEKALKDIVLDVPLNVPFETKPEDMVNIDAQLFTTENNKLAFDFVFRDKEIKK